MKPQIPSLDRYTIEALIDTVANKHMSITYGELAKAVGQLRGEAMSPRGFSECLGRIQEYCKELDLPALSVMVTLKGESTPGDGFISCYRSLHPEAAGKTDQAIIAEETEGCLTCKNWQSLLGFIAAKSNNAEQIALHTYEEGERVAQGASDEIKRSPAARAACLAAKGTRCIVCEKDSVEIYGIPGIVHVHHLDPLSESTGSHEVDPVEDLVPVCPNCHAVIHSKKCRDGEPSVYTPNEVRAMLGLAPLETY